MQFIILLVLTALSAHPGRSDPLESEGNAPSRYIRSDECSDFGCWKGYCWAKCKEEYYEKTPYEYGSSEWCYTTKSYSQSYSYVKCTDDTEDEDCSGCWKCAGPCTV